MRIWYLNQGNGQKICAISKDKDKDPKYPHMPEK